MSLHRAATHCTTTGHKQAIQSILHLIRTFMVNLRIISGAATRSYQSRHPSGYSGACYKVVGVGFVNWLRGVGTVSASSLQDTSSLADATIWFASCAASLHLGVQAMASSRWPRPRWLVCSSMAALCPYGGGMLTVYSKRRPRLDRESIIFLSLIPLPYSRTPFTAFYAWQSEKKIFFSGTLSSSRPKLLKKWWMFETKMF